MDLRNEAEKELDFLGYTGNGRAIFFLGAATRVLAEKKLRERGVQRIYGEVITRVRIGAKEARDYIERLAEDMRIDVRWALDAFDELWKEGVGCITSEERVFYFAPGYVFIRRHLYGELPRVMTAPEAAERWGVNYDTLRAALTQGKFNREIQEGLVRKHRGTWLIADEAMMRVYGEPTRLN